MAATSGNEVMVQLLLEAKADVDAKDFDGATPLLLAVQNRHGAVVRLLLEAKADVAAAKDSCWYIGTTWLI